MSVIKTKVNYPFVYFFIEHNAVLVYKIKTRQFVTVSDMSENEEWQTYEVEHEDAFETFHHEKSNPLEDKGYVMNQNDLNRMVETVNTYIQKHRNSFPSNLIEEDEQVAPVHIVTSESAAGSLRVGLERPKVVIGFPDSLSIGPLCKLHEKAGQMLRNEWIYDHINYEYDDFEYENNFANTVREIADIPVQFPIYIWYGDNVDEQIGLRFLLFLLRDKANDIFLMNSTELYERYILPKVGGRKISYTGHIESKDLGILFEKGRKAQPLSEKEQMQLQEEWLFLAQTKEVLRIWAMDGIKGVQENHFDSLIINTIEKMHHRQGKMDFIKVGMVIGEVLSGTNEGVNPFFLEYRIRHLLYNGFFDLKGIPKSMRHYSIKVRIY
ncbi:DUF1835 domain-containing protein [Sporosarcina koreensis]|uniref:DUF1835 domain-containing protein n=1 Tax=Bacillales TaxID=1385 RepID=UPI0007552483|nr:DUF1835 domain-containing protein [Sporosarcina koreensis]